MKLVVVRHGQAGGNKAGIIMSQHDVGLTEAGHKQAKELAEDLSIYNFDTIYSSPLSRCLDSVKPYADKVHQKIQVDERLKEVNFGSFIGKHENSTIPVFGKDVDGILGSYNYDLRDYGGESAGQVEKRVKSFLDEVKSSGANQILIATHDGIFHWVYYLIEGKKIDVVPNASIHEFNI